MPPLKTYVYIPITGRILLRTIMPGSEETKVAKKASSGAASSGGASSGGATASSGGATASGQNKNNPAGPGSAKGAEPPTTPKATGQTLSADNDDIDGEENPDDQEEGNFDNEINELEALEQEMGGGTAATNPKKRGRPMTVGGSANK